MLTELNFLEITVLRDFVNGVVFFAGEAILNVNDSSVLKWAP